MPKDARGLRSAPRWQRWKINAAERAVLQHTLQETHYPDWEQLSSISCILDVPVRNIQVWFQNQRQRNGVGVRERAHEFGSHVQDGAQCAGWLFLHREWQWRTLPTRHDVHAPSALWQSKVARIEDGEGDVEAEVARQHIMHVLPAILTYGHEIGDILQNDS